VPELDFLNVKIRPLTVVLASASSYLCCIFQNVIPLAC